LGFQDIGIQQGIHGVRNKMAAAALSHDSTTEGIYYFCNSCGDWYPEGKIKTFQAVA